MAPTDVKALVRRHVDEVWNRANLAALEDMTTASPVYRLGRAIWPLT